MENRVHYTWQSHARALFVVVYAFLLLRIPQYEGHNGVTISSLNLL